jgi:hypothetical protein
MLPPRWLLRRSGCHCSMRSVIAHAKVALRPEVDQGVDSVISTGRIATLARVRWVVQEFGDGIIAIEKPSPVQSLALLQPSCRLGLCSSASYYDHLSVVLRRQ